ncbi:MAG: hypothetical protein LCH51_06790 [Bacteroidetes bacterium]|nr:hypothetical protein [Bacteroidota bacterium]
MSEVKTWKQWQPVDDLLEQVLAAGRPRLSIHPIAKLQSALFQHLVWSSFITVGYMLLLLGSDYWQVWLGLLAAIGFNSVVIWKGIKLYRGLQKITLADTALLPLLQQFLDNCRRWEQLQYRLAVWVYPLAIAAGYLFGGTMATGLPIHYLLQQPLFAWGLPIIVLGLSIAGYFLARHLFKRKFGRYIKQLQANLVV